MTNERLTLEEMEVKFPDKWLFIVECDYNERTELLSGIVAAHSESCDEIHNVSIRYNGGAAIHYTGRMPEGMEYIL